MHSLAHRLATAPRRPRPAAPVPVALVITDLDVGGAERALVSLATGLDRARWHPHVIALGPEGALAAPLREAGLRTTCLGASPRHPARGVARLVAALRQARPALVQSFLFHANIAARLAAPWAGGPWVVGGVRVAEKRKDWHLLLDALTIPLAAGSVCVSDGVWRFTRHVGRIPGERLAVIPNGIDPAPLDRAAPADRAPLGIPDGAHLALFVGRIDVQKGVAHLLDAARAVTGIRPDWHLALVGDGPERALLQGRAGDLAGRVHWLGRRDDVPALLKAADVLVLPSLWEGMPNVVLEAMAARRAVVGTKVEGTEDLILPGETGWLIPPGDPAPLAAALLDAAADPGRCRRFGAAGRLRVEERFTRQATLRAYDRLWSGLLGFEEAAIGLKPGGGDGR